MSTRATWIAFVATVLAGCAAATPTPAAPERSSVNLAEQDFVTAEDFGERGDFVRAEQYYVSALRRGHPDTQVIVRLMRVCLGASRLRAALDYARLYLLEHPDAHSLRYLAATIHLALDQPYDARRELLNVLHAEPAHAGAERLLARLDTKGTP
jgi:predicted Zn-dependent protease